MVQRASDIALVNVTPKKRSIPLDQVHCRNAPVSPLTKRARLTATADPKATGGKPASNVEGGQSGARADGNLSANDAQPQDMSQPRVPPAARVHPKAHTQDAVLTTTRIDKTAKVSDAERQLREQKREAEMAAYRDKFRRAFPTYTFYLDGFDDASKKYVQARVEALGGRVDAFFSKSCTHFIAGRTPLGKKDANARGNTQVEEAGKKLRAKENANPAPTLSDKNPFDEGKKAAPNNLAQKAEQLGIKVWPKQKFLSIVDCLEDKGIRSKGPALPNDLSRMLHQEKVHGTLERDQAAEQNGVYYFPKGSVYLLVEDATGEHRPIAVEEYKTVAEGEDPPWPQLYNECEGRCPFSRVEENRRKPHATANAHQTLRRTVSLNQLRAPTLGVPVDALRPSAESRREYPLASGNSMQVTSNVGSTTSALHDSNVTGVPQMGLDPRVAQMTRKTMTAPTLADGQDLALAPVRQFMALRASGRANQAAGGGIRRSVSANDATAAAAKDKAQAESKAGYCEICRMKFDDFDEHILGRKHRKFATNPENWWEIDDLIENTSRALHDREVAEWEAYCNETHSEDEDDD